MDSDSVRGVGRRRLLGWGGVAAAGVAAGPLVGAGPGHADPGPTGADIPPAARPGGAYDRFVAELAAQDKFSGVVLLSHRGRTVLSRGYGMADRERRIHNHENVAFNLSSASGPFRPVAVMRLVQQGRVKLSDTVGTYLDGIATDIAEQVTIHHLIIGMAGMDAPGLDVHRIFNCTAEVDEYHRQWVRQATLVEVPGAGSSGHTAGGAVASVMAAQIVEAVTGTTYWDYVHEHVFGRAGMRGSAYYTRTQWLTDEHIAHPYMRQPGGSRVDAVRNLDKDSLSQQGPYENPGRSFIGDVFATAPDLARFAHALSDGTVLDRPYADLYTGAKHPGPGDRIGAPAFKAYMGPVHVIDGQWVFNRGGGSGGVSASWTVHLDSGWVGVVLSNYDDLQEFGEILQRQDEAITGRRMHR